MHYIDTHCHFNFPIFTDELEHSLAQVRQAYVAGIVTPATNADDFVPITQLARRIPEVFAALGLHPLWTQHHHDDHVLRLATHLAADDNIIAIGEIGIDFYTPELCALAARQWQLLSAQLDLAKSHSLPVILHSRKSHDPLAKLLKETQLPATGVIHGFTGSYQQAKRFVDLGFFLGVGGSISYSRAHKTRDAISKIPLEYLVAETDAPDMPLQGYQGEANRPERVTQVCDILAELKKRPVEALQEVLWQNSLRLFPKLARVLS